MKTLVAARHELGPMQNGAGGCHARWGNQGLCPGHNLAKWLNEMGEDEDIYIKGNPLVAGANTVTCGQVRRNWLDHDTHIVATEPRLAELSAERIRLRRELAYINREIKRLQKTRETKTVEQVHV